MSYRTEIQTTLERLKTVEGELTVKERELREREVQLMAWEKDLQHQMYVSVSMGNIIVIFPNFWTDITQTHPCNIQQYFTAVKMLIFR